MLISNFPTASSILQHYIDKYVTTYAHGKMEDQLGDAFEAYCVDIFSSIDLIKHINGYGKIPAGYSQSDSLIVQNFIQLCNIPLSQITNIKATNHIPSLPSGGNPKTDVLITIDTDSNSIQFPISIKHSTRKIVSIAEFSADQIIKGVGITDTDVIRLMEKHQKDGSAKNFTKQEQVVLKNGLSQYKVPFVRWVFTGSKVPTADIRCPDFLIKFNIHPYRGQNIIIHSIDISTMDDYIQRKIQGKAGFGTGLSWTYATGSKGTKIQFKGWEKDFPF